MRGDVTGEPGETAVHAKAKVCLVGANMGCKTNLVRSHILELFDDRYLRTLGTKVGVKRLRITQGPGHPSVFLDLLLFDVLSQWSFRKVLQHTYFHGASGILAVTDMTRRATLREAGEWIAWVETVTGDIPVVVIGANRDRTDRQEIAEEEVQRLADSYGAACFFASANSREPVEAAFMILAERIASRKFRQAPDAR